MSAPPSPDSKKKKPALPSLLSNLRNARQAVVGRASDAAEDFLYERELRPLTGGGGAGGGGSSGALGLLSSNSTGGGGPQHLQRGGGGGGGGGGIGVGGVGGIGATSSSSSMSSNSTTLSTTLQNFSQRFGNKFRSGGGKSRTRRKKGSGVTVVPQEFYVAVGCFFFVFPIFFLIYIYIAGHSVFGDGSDGSHQIQKIDQEDGGFGILNQTDLDSQPSVEYGDNSQGMLIEDEIMGKLHDGSDDSILGIDSSGQHSKIKVPFNKRNIDSSLMEDNTKDSTGNEHGNASASKLEKRGNVKRTSTSNNYNTVSDPEGEIESGNTRSSFDQNDERGRE